MPSFNWNGYYSLKMFKWNEAKKKQKMSSLPRHVPWGARGDDRGGKTIQRGIELGSGDSQAATLLTGLPRADGRIGILHLFH